MSPTTAAAMDSANISSATESVNQTEPESNHNLPARTMTEEERHDEPTPQKEDPATVAASEELRHTSISDKAATVSKGDTVVTESEAIGEDKEMRETGKASTPEPEPSDVQDEEMRERLSSPKKKRGRDQDEDVKDLEGDNLDEPGSSADGSVLNGSRSTRLGPEKKRPRDGSEDRSTESVEVTDANDATKAIKTLPEDVETAQKNTDSSDKPIIESGLNHKPQTSASAFASSGFASLAAASTSPFGSIAASKPSVFGAGAQSTISGFGALAGSKSPTSTSTVTTSGFGALPGEKPVAGFGFGSGVTSGFGGLGGGSAFGSALGNGFAGGVGQKLSSFAAPGTQSKSTGSKPAKAFGAPESDEEDGSNGDDSDGGAATDDEESGIVVSEDKKKSKLTRIHVEDGESGEATLLQIRAKLFAIDSKEVGWKERGVGTLKINVPQSCVSFGVNGLPIPGSFDASGLEDEDEDSNAPRVARLIMRQENTHRVVLNTIIVRAMEFQDKPSASTAQILFTAFEGDKEPKPINMLLKMSEANARLFRSEVESIQREL